MSSESPRLLDRLRDRIRLKHYSIRTEDAYTQWVRQGILYHGRRNPRDRGPAAVREFLTHLAVRRSAAALTQNQAKSALLMLDMDVIGTALPWLSST